MSNADAEIMVANPIIEYTNTYATRKSVVELIQMIRFSRLDIALEISIYRLQKELPQKNICQHPVSL